jgi:WD40 repeat protein
VHSSASGAPLWQLIGHTDRVNCVVFAGSDRFIITCGQDKLVIFWQLPAAHSKSPHQMPLQPLFSLPFHVEIARISSIGNAVVFAALDTRIGSKLPCVCSDGAFNLGASLSLFFDGCLLKYLTAEHDAAVTCLPKNRLYSRYLLPPVWIIERILASSHYAAKAQLRCMLEGPAAGTNLFPSLVALADHPRSFRRSSSS